MEPVKFILYKDGKPVSNYAYTIRELSGMFGVAEVTVRKWKEQTFRDGYSIKEVIQQVEKRYSTRDKQIMREWDRVTARYRKRGGRC